MECATAISYLVSHRLVYASETSTEMTESQTESLLEQTKKQDCQYILDALMYLSGNDSSNEIRTTAFSTLSNLSKNSASCQHVTAQIARDIKIPSDLQAKDYLSFIQKRLQTQKDMFYSQKKKEGVESQYSGLYSLLRLAQDPSDLEVEDASNKYIEFIKTPYDHENESLLRNEGYFIKVF